MSVAEEAEADAASVAAEATTASNAAAAEGEADVPATDLSQLVKELATEGAIVPSRHLRQLVQEEAWRRQREAGGAGGDGHPALLSRLVEEVLEYCRVLLLPHGPSREVQLAKLLARCAETYAQLLLANSGTSFCRVVVRHAIDGREVPVSVRTDATIWDVKEALACWLGRPEILVSAQLGTEGMNGRLVRVRNSEQLGAKRHLLVRDAELSAEKGSPAQNHAFREARASLRIACTISSIQALHSAIDKATRAGLALSADTEMQRAKQLLGELETKQGGADADGATGPVAASGAAAQVMPSPRPRRRLPEELALGSETSTPRTRPRPQSSRGVRKEKQTPFFEAVYAIVIRAAQQGLRAAVGNQDKGELMQLAARAEDELCQLFRSKEFGQGTGGGTRRGGGKVASVGSAQEESAKSVAQLEDNLGKLFQTSSRQKKDMDQKFDKLEALFKLSEEIKESQPEKDGKDRDAPQGSSENKDSSADVDMLAITKEVDDVIAGFRAGAPSRRRRDVGMPGSNRVSSGTTRSPIMTLLLPSASVQARSLSHRGPGREPVWAKLGPPFDKQASEQSGPGMWGLFEEGGQPLSPYREPRRMSLAASSFDHNSVL